MEEGNKESNRQKTKTGSDVTGGRKLREKERDRHAKIAITTAKRKAMNNGGSKSGAIRLCLCLYLAQLHVQDELLL